MILHSDASIYRYQVMAFGADHPAAVLSMYSDRQACVSRQAKMLSPFIKFAEPTSVLELGFGNLITYDALCDLGMDPSEYYGLEVLPEFIQVAKQRGVPVGLEIPDREFDYGVAFGTFALKTENEIRSLTLHMMAKVKSLVLGVTLNTIHGYKLNVHSVLDCMSDGYKARVTIENNFLMGVVTK